MDYNGTTYYLSYNHLGSLKAVRTSSGVVKQIDYDSFGNILNDTNPNLNIPLAFAGGLYDKDTGLIRFGYRDYGPFTGRWTAKDPIDFNGGSSNLYTYVGNDPVNAVDPEGLAYVSLHWGADINEMGIGIGGLNAFFAGTTRYHDDFLVIAHGAVGFIQINDELLGAKRFSEVIRERGWNEGQPVRLLVCDSGTSPNGGASFGEQLSRYLNVPVTAVKNGKYALWMNPIFNGPVGGAQMITFRP
jgi:RHS repeat-associated protein